MKISMVDKTIVVTNEVFNKMLTAKGVDLRNGVLTVFESKFNCEKENGFYKLVSIGYLDYPSTQSILSTVGVILDKQ